MAHEEAPQTPEEAAREKIMAIFEYASKLTQLMAIIGQARNMKPNGFEKGGVPIKGEETRD